MGKFIIIMLFCGVCTLTAQEQTKQEFQHQIGVAGSLISGMGISYQYIFSDDYRVKCTGLYYNETKTIQELGEDDTYMAIGIEGQKTLIKAAKTRIFGFLGLGYYPTISKNMYSDALGRYITNKYAGGAGIGIELLAVGRLAFNIELGILYSFEETRGTYTSSSYNNLSYSSEVGLGVGGGLGFGYRF